jgi:hypothetical protein
MHYLLGELAADTCGAIAVRKKVDGKWIDKVENQWLSFGPGTKACEFVPCWVYYWGCRQLFNTPKFREIQILRSGYL